MERWIQLDITIQRYRKEELELAIKDLVSRGWTVIKDSTRVSGLHKEFTYKEKGLKQNDIRSYNKYGGCEEHGVYKARLRKV